MDPVARSQARKAALRGVLEALKLADAGDSLVVLGDAMAEVQNGLATSFPLPSPSNADVIGKEPKKRSVLKGKSDAVLSLLADGSARLVSEIAPVVYGTDSPEDKNRVRAILSFLAKQGKVQQLIRGQWTLAAPKTDSIADPAESLEREPVRDVILRVLADVPPPGLRAGDVIVAVRKDPLHRGANPQTVNAALYELFNAGEVSRHGEGRGDFRYAR